MEKITQVIDWHSELNTKNSESNDFSKAFHSYGLPSESIKPGSEILVIDDNDAVLHSLVQLLEQKGYTVWGFQSPVEGLDWYQENHLDTVIVLLDLQMPEIDGAGCFEKIKEINPEQKIAIMSAGDNWDLVSRLKKGGAKKFFRKPFDFKSLLTWIGHESNSNKEDWLIGPENIRT